MITKIIAREILDSRGNPTVEVDLYLASGIVERAAVPSGASTGIHEALELRDHDPRRFNGWGALLAIKNIQEIIAPALLNREWDQAGLDGALQQLDGTERKTRLGANALLAVSLAFARATALENQEPLYVYLQKLSSTASPRLPAPMFNILNGGYHAPGGTDIQEFMIIPIGAPSYREALRYGTEVYQQLKKIIAGRGLPTTVGDEGGCVLADESDNETGLRLLTEAITAAGYKASHDISLAIDAAASEFYREGAYHLDRHRKILTSSELIDMYERWSLQYPLIMVEDGLAQDDWAGWQELTQRLGSKIKLVGDDLFVTNTARLRLGLEKQVANAILIKPNQIGTLTETLEVIKQARVANYEFIVSHRSGETEDTFIADLAVGTAAPFIKCGAPARSERTAKYNQLLRIAEEIEK